MLRLRTFGTATLEGDDGPVGGAATQRKRLALLALLAVAGDTGLSRDKLVAYLWPERDERARHLLAQTLYALRRELGGEEVVLGSDPVRLNPQLLPSDVAEFETALDKGELEQAASLYRGPFLDGFHMSGCEEFERWQESVRNRMLARHREALVTLAGRAERAGDATARVARWKELAALDPYDATTAMGLMRALAAAGNLAGALQHARTYATLVKQELDAEPDGRVNTLAEQLKREEPTVTVRTSGGTANGSRSSNGDRSSLPNARSSKETRNSAPLQLLRRGTPLRLRLDLEPHELEALDRADANAAASAPASRPTPARWSDGLHLRSPRRRLLAGAAVAMTIAAIAWGTAAMLRARTSTTPSVPAANRIAVLPFTVHGSASFAYLRQAMAEVFSASLDGVDELRSADVGTVIRAASSLAESTIDPEVARTIAARVNAEHFLIGEVTEASGVLHVDAALYDTRGGRAVLAARAEARGRAEGMFKLVDSITSRLAVIRSAAVDEGFREKAIAAPLTVIKPYLAGQRAFREKRFGDGIEAYRRAVATDSTFAPAWYSLAELASWMNDADDARAHATQAVRYSADLPPRDRTLARALLAYVSGLPDDAEREYRTLTATGPDDIAAWRGIGEVLFHYNWQRGRSITESRDAWEHVLRASPDDWGARLHLSEILARDGDTRALDSLVKLQTVGRKSDVTLLPVRALRAFVVGDTAAQREALADEVATTHFWPMVSVWMVALAGQPDGAERLARNLLTPQRRPEVHAITHVMLAQIAMSRGRWRMARHEIDAVDSAMSGLASRYRALAYASPFVPATRDELEAARARLARSAPEPRSVNVTTPSPWLNVHDGLDSLIDSYLGAALSLRLADQSSAATQATRLERFGSTPDSRRLARALAVSIRAELPGQRRRLTEVSLAADSIPFSLFETSPYFSLALARFRRAQALEAAGDLAAALRSYNSFPANSLYDLVFVAPSQLARGRILERQGDRAGAVAAYSAAVALWRDGDPEARLQVADAERALARLNRR